MRSWATLCGAFLLSSCVSDAPILPGGGTDAAGGPDTSMMDVGTDTSAMDAAGDAISDASTDPCGNACGGCGNMCPDNQHFCVNAKCAKFVFVTDKKVDGNLGGISGATQTCTSEAQGKLPGQYVPWLGDSGDPNSVGDATLRMPKPWPTVPYVLADGTVIADNFATIVAVRNGNGFLMHPINMTQTKLKTSELVWTGDGQSTALCKDNNQAAPHSSSFMDSANTAGGT